MVEHKQLRLEFKPGGAEGTPSSKLTQTNEEYFALEPQCTEDDARCWFRYFYGREPAEVVNTGGAVLVGPIGDSHET